MRASRPAILTYHSLDDSGSVISTSPEEFRRQMDAVAAAQIPVAPLDQVCRRAGSIAITFDDGFCNLLDYALPTLERHGFPATIFVVSGYCGRRNEWPTQPRGTVPDLPLLGWSDLARLPKNVSLGAHTVTHPDLTRIAPGECERELRDNQAEMEQQLARPVRWLAYPYGALSAAVKQIARRYFDLAVSTTLDFLPLQPDPLDLPRIDTYYLRGRLTPDRLFTAQGGLYVRVRKLLRNLRRIAG